MPIPAIVILLCAGIVAGILSPWHFGDQFAFATLYVLLPALLFEAALKLDSTEMRRQWLPIALLARPLRVISRPQVTLGEANRGGSAWKACDVLVEHLQNDFR
ncbi:MAG: hypothetical protein NVS1B14_08200 [Vulcanimicrobiaceae bacterium]